MTKWLIWCWRSYLSSKTTTTTNSNDDDDCKLDFSTNQIHVEAWMKHQQNNNDNHNLFRFIYPTIGVPAGGGRNNNVKFIIVTSLADPLHDEGVELVNKMEQMGYTELKHYETMSAHATYFWCDKSMTKRIFHEWANCIFQF